MIEIGVEGLRQQEGGVRHGCEEVEIGNHVGQRQARGVGNVCLGRQVDVAGAEGLATRQLGVCGADAASLPF